MGEPITHFWKANDRVRERKAKPPLHLDAKRGNAHPLDRVFQPGMLAVAAVGGEGKSGNRKRFVRIGGAAFAESEASGCYVRAARWLERWNPHLDRPVIIGKVILRKSKVTVLALAAVTVMFLVFQVPLGLT